MSLIEQLTDIALADPAPTAHPVFSSASISSMKLEPSPIEPSWIISGRPEARAVVQSRSADDFSSTTIWECTEGAFRWHFAWDETVHILSGSVRVTDETGKVTTIKAGDVAYFAAGSWATWEIDDHVRKIAFCRRAFPGPVVKALSVKSWVSSALRGRPAAASGAGLTAAPVTAQGS